MTRAESRLWTVESPHHLKLDLSSETASTKHSFGNKYFSALVGNACMNMPPSQKWVYDQNALNKVAKGERATVWRAVDADAGTSILNIYGVSKIQNS